MKILFLLAFLIATIEHNKGYAFPIFYTCEDEQLKTSAKIDSNDLFQKYLAMEKSDRLALLNSWCGDSTECMRNLENIVSFSKISFDSAKEIFVRELGKLKKSKVEKVNDTKLLSEINKFYSVYNEIQACQNTATLLNSEDYITDNGSILTPYPYHSNYMYVTGCSSVNGKSCNPMDKSSTDRVIQESILMEADPYLVIALTLMEEGTSMGSLYLDPIGKMDAIGCRGQQLKNGAKNSLNSYGTSYRIEASVKKNTKLSNKLKNFLSQTNRASVTEGKSYYCYDTLGKGKPKTYSSSQENSCCLELNFEAVGEKNIGSEISHALTYEYINKRLRPKFRGKSAPEWKVQRFNGYTDMMGAAEGVPSWRVGVNYYENPGYGKQVMDYMLNALMFNPYITQQVKNKTTEANSEWSSILCIGRENGTYYYDSDRFFNEVRDSKRLGVIYDKYVKGVKFSELSVRESNVITRELYETSSKNPEMPNLLREAVVTKYENDVLDALELNSEDLFEKTPIPKEEVWQSFKDDLKITREEFDLLMTEWDKQDLNREKIDIVQDKLNKLQTQLYGFCNKIHSEYSEMPRSTDDELNASDLVYDKYKKCNDDTNLVTNYMWDVDEDSLSLSESSPVLEFIGKVKDLTAQYKKLRKEQEDSFQGEKFDKLTAIFLKDQAMARRLFSGRFSYEPLDKALNRLRKSENYSSSIEKKIRSLYHHQEEQRKGVDFEDAYKYYFESMYQSRDTLGKTSDYSWERLKPEQVKKLLPKILRN